MRRLALSLSACVLLAACGETQEPPRRVFEVKAPSGTRSADFPEPGMAFERPRNWRLRRRVSLPAVFELSSGEALVSGWAYLRVEPLPETGAQLEAARGRLVDAIEKRDPEYRVISSSTTEVGGSLAIDVLGEQVIAKRRLRTRSVHVFEGEVEYVIEALAPPRDFRLVDSRVLEPLLGSLELEGEIAEEGG